MSIIVNSFPNWDWDIVYLERCIDPVCQLSDYCIFSKHMFYSCALL